MASSPSATTVLTGGGKRRKAKVTGKSKDYRWVKKVNKSNMSNVQTNGPFGEACAIPQIKNTKTNRKRLQTPFYRFHKHKPFHCVSILQIKNTKTNRKRLQTPFYRFHKHKLFHCVSPPNFLF